MKRFFRSIFGKNTWVHFSKANRLGRCGKETYIDKSVQFIGAHRIEVGRNCCIGEHSWLNVNDWEKPAAAIRVGDFSFIGRRNFFNAGKGIFIGDYCLTGPGVELQGADHCFSDPMVPYIKSPTQPGGEISIGTNCWLASKVSVLKNTVVGCGSVIGTASLVTEDIPPFSLAVGNPARVIRRFSFARKMWIAVKEWTRQDEDSLPSEDQYRSTLRESCPWIRMPRPAASSLFGDL
jgi:acetyltransferase-like isoleucine patch superfamily enzyme